MHEDESGSDVSHSSTEPKDHMHSPASGKFCSVSFNSEAVFFWTGTY